MDSRLDKARQYVDGWHSRYPGATALVMAGARDGQNRSSYELLAECVAAGTGPVLDLACGDGYLLELLCHRAEFPLGIDASWAELAAARRRLGSGFGLVRGDATHLPFPDGSVAGVTCHFALMLLQPLENVLVELARVMRPAGDLVAVVPGTTRDDATNAWIPFRSALRDLVAAHSVEIPAIQDDRALVPEVLATLLEGCGLRFTSTRQVELRRTCTIEEAKTVVLLTYVPELLPASAQAELDERLTSAYSGLADHEGRVSFSEDVNLVVAQKVG